MLLTESVTVKWNPNNRKCYENKGYTFTQWNDEFAVKVRDLSNGSKASVSVKCDGYGETLTGIRWFNYKRYVRESGKYYCKKCASRLFGNPKRKKNDLENGKSLERWCYEKLLKKTADELLSRWDYDKNENLTPTVICHSSHGSDGKGYWFKCLLHPEHASERKNINSFTSGSQRDINCSQCNKIAITHPELEIFLKNKDNLLTYSGGSGAKIPMNCPNCGFEKQMSINTLIWQGFSCPICSVGYYPEKFLFNVLKQLGLEFKPQATKTTLPWCGAYRFDFYILFKNWIIETHGRHHYKQVKNWGALIDIQNNDDEKENIATENGIENYITLDCRNSNRYWIKSSIMNSKLPSLLGFKENDIDWLKSHEVACSSMVRESCDLWRSGINSTLTIAHKLQLDRHTIIRYLKMGAEAGMCDYNAKEESKKRTISFIKNLNVKVICLTTGEIFDSVNQACEKYNLASSSISSCCSRIDRHKSAGKDSITGEKFVWMHHDEYLKRPPVREVSGIVVEYGKIIQISYRDELLPN